MTTAPRLICATITPFTADGDLDVAGLGRLFGWLKAQGIDHVFTPGTTGEFTGLDDSERLMIIEAALEIFGPAGVFAHIGAATARQASRLAAAATRIGATRLAAITPYFVQANLPTVEHYYRAITEAAPGAEVYVYLFSARTSTVVDPRGLGRLSQIPGVAGAKISGLDTADAIEYVRCVPADFPVYCGNDRELLRFIRAGGAGTVSGVSGVFPAPFLRAVAALDEPGRTDLTPIQSAIDEVVELTGAGSFSMLKLGVGARGLPAGPLRIATEAPWPALAAELVARIRRESDT